VEESTSVKRLVVIADDPGYALAQQVVALPHESSRQGEAPIVLDVEISVQAATSISGRVLDEAGSPVAGACVLLFAREKTKEPLAEAACASDGRFVLRPGRGGSLELIASTRSPGSGRWYASPLMRPTSIDLELESDQGRDVGDLLLHPGAFIAGVVRFGGKPVAGIHVSAGLRNASHAFESTSLAFSRSAGAGALENSRATALTDAQGRYRLDGLAQGEYEVVVVSGEDGMLFDDDEKTRPSRTVNAPASSADFELDVPGSRSM
jgi:hypothetical protein